MHQGRQERHAFHGVDAACLSNCGSDSTHEGLQAALAQLSAAVRYAQATVGSLDASLLQRGG
jgi:hypothetical protein